MRVGFGPPDRAQAAALPTLLPRADATDGDAVDGRGWEDESSRRDASGRRQREVVAPEEEAPRRVRRCAAADDPDSLDRLAERFADAAARSMWDLHPDGDDVAASMAALQGHLMMHRRGSRGAIDSL